MTSTMTIPEGVYQQITDAYRAMGTMSPKAYRPMAPSDGMGHITAHEAELDLNNEAHRYAAQWWADEDRHTFWVGCCNYPTRAATIYAVEAARLMCGAAPKKLIAALLGMALDALRRSEEQKEATCPVTPS
jgi:hypothetical protein